MQLGDAYAHKVLDWILGSSLPPTVNIALLSEVPPTSGVGYVECTGGGYASLSVSNADVMWPAAVGRQKSNGQAVNFGAVTGTPFDLPATHFAILDGPAGLFITGGELATHFVGNVGDVASFAAGALVVLSPAV